MQHKRNPLLILALALAGSLAMAPARADDNPFARGGDGYAIAAAGEAMKCGAGKCGAAMTGAGQKDTGKAKAKDKAKADKCGAGKCGAAMGMTEQDKARMSNSAEGKCAGAGK